MEIRLVLQITVDQLRGDLPFRYWDRLASDGFRYFADHGIVFADAHHTHSNTETVVGHATLATGAHPSEHGMIANVWYDVWSRRSVYNVEDPEHPVLPAPRVVGDTPMLPGPSAVHGRSPRAMLASTFADELALATSGAAKVFAVSVKDRAAISMAGQAGIAYWFSKGDIAFVTSAFYMTEYPDWVRTWTAKNRAASYGDRSWSLLADASTYRFAGFDDRAWEVDAAGFGRTFPHAYGAASGPDFAARLTISPAGDALTLDFSKALIDAEGLGTDQVTDYLSVSFSSTDYVGHAFGPESLESEDTILRLDRAIADLLHHVDASVGLDHTLVVLSGDHGGAEVPSVSRARGLRPAVVDPEAWSRDPRFEQVEQELGLDGPVIEAFESPYVYLDRTVIARAGLDLPEVQRAVAVALEGQVGVVEAIAAADIEAGRLSDTMVHRAVVHNYHPQRSGDVHVVLAPYAFYGHDGGLTVAGSHGQPWTQDSFVPLMFAGVGLPAAEVHRRVETVSVARTLSAVLRIKPPTAAVGPVLEEVAIGLRRP